MTDKQRLPPLSLLPLLLLSVLLLGACGAESEAPLDTATDAAAAPAEAQARPVATAAPEASDQSDDIARLLADATAGDHRSDGNRARDQYRNPVETLQFFGLAPDMTVVEVWPGGGWYTEILAPVLREQGRLIAAGFPEDGSPYQVRMARALNEKLAAEPDVYDRVEVIGFAPPDHSSMGEPGSADLVLLSRAFHNLIAGNNVDGVLAAAHEVLRPGGVLAVIQHRDLPDAAPEEDVRTGYVREDYVIERVTAAGFELADSSEINANPRDTRDHEAGVWTLPPSLRLCGQVEDEAERAACEAQYRAIGESDRMTLKFVKTG